MATSDTASSFAQWSDLYHHDPTLGQYLGAAADSTVVTSTPAATSPTSAGSCGGSGSPTRALTRIEGPRVGKPAPRKRSRASRRAPVTLLNTDTANFRAMVQQFTGFPDPSPFAGGHSGAPVINFAGDYGFPPPASAMSFDHLLHHQRQPPQFQDHQLRQQQQYTGASFGYSSMQGLAGGSHGDLFAREGLGSAEDRMFLQSMQAAASAANNSTNGYFA